LTLFDPSLLSIKLPLSTLTFCEFSIHIQVFAGSGQFVRSKLNKTRTPLITIGYQVYVGKQGDKEIDFVAEKNDEKIYVQVCYLIADEKYMSGNLEICCRFATIVQNMWLAWTKRPAEISKE
jgi:hypothetical protein